VELRWWPARRIAAWMAAAIEAALLVWRYSRRFGNEQRDRKATCHSVGRRHQPHRGSAEHDGTQKSQYESQLNAFITMPYSKLAKSMLERESVFQRSIRGRAGGHWKRRSAIRRSLSRGDSAADASRRAQSPGAAQSAGDAQHHRAAGGADRGAGAEDLLQHSGAMFGGRCSDRLP